MKQLKSTITKMRGKKAPMCIILIHNFNVYQITNAKISVLVLQFIHLFCPFMQRFFKVNAYVWIPLLLLNPLKDYSAGQSREFECNLDKCTLFFSTHSLCNCWSKNLISINSLQMNSLCSDDKKTDDIYKKM